MQKELDMFEVSDNNIIIDMFGRRMDEMQARQINILTLAYLGDCIHDLYVRSHRCSCGKDKRINAILKLVVEFVNANAQADCLDAIYNELSDIEMSVYKRGRNSKSMPTKNTDKLHYNKATGLEAVLGYLYVSGQDKRLLYILNKCYKHINEGRKEFWDKQG